MAAPGEPIPDQTADELRRRIGWGGRTRTWIWRDQKPKEALNHQQLADF
jgi:hypothetical protein